MEIKEFINKIFNEKQSRLTQISDQIWSFAETRYEEYQSAELLCDELEREGFKVERKVAGIETAFIGSYGNNGPIIGFLGEFDALPNLSQKAGITHKEAIELEGNGHGCGHNLLGVGSLAAAIATKKYIEQNGVEATVRYYGCPAEEGGSGKAYMVRDGLFDDVDLALTWHPFDYNMAYHAEMLATLQVYFRFKGKSAHASFVPHLGRSALDAVELMNVGANYLREHIIPEARLHYAITKTGGHAPNIVQSDAEVLYKIRAPRIQQVKEIFERVKNVAKGAALMTETEMEYEIDGSSASLIPNNTLASLIFDHLKEFGPETFTEEEKDFAKKLQVQFMPNAEHTLYETIEKHSETPKFIPASTDVGDVSWVVPTGQVYTTTCAYGTPFHSWYLVTQGKSTIAHKGMLLAGKVLAASAIDAILNPTIIAKAKENHKKELKNEQYESLIPKDKTPYSKSILT